MSGFRRKQIYAILVSALVLCFLNIFVLLRIKAEYKSTLQSENKDQTTVFDRSRFLQKVVNCYDSELKPQLTTYANYWLWRNFIIGSKSLHAKCAETITYTTHGDYTFLENLPYLLQRWQAPISFALFTPGFDLLKTLESIQYARNCLPESDLIRQHVTFHLYSPREHLLDDVYSFHANRNHSNWMYNCSLSAPYLNVSRQNFYKTQMNLTYPINVGRNIARQSANTHFIFACDIELYPSRHLINQFLDLIANRTELVAGDVTPRVFPIPVFEIQANASIPESKLELLQMLMNKTAISFHQRLCNRCHTVPHFDEWLVEKDSVKMTIVGVGKRENKYSSWEPFYISDNREPLFDERITWEGQGNKRIQGVAMCLMHYDYHILHPAFLIHHPGIKVFDKNSPRLKFVSRTNALIKKEIMPEYRKIYGNNKNCVL